MPYPTRSCVVIEPVVPFMEFLVQFEPFDYSSLNIIDHQKHVYEMYHEESNHHEKSSLSINHECTVKIDGVVKVSVNKINGPNELSLQNITINIFKHDHDKGVDVLFRALTTLVPESWTPKLYAIFLCDLALRQSMWICIYLHVTYDTSIKSINEINVLYSEKHSKLTYDANSPLVCYFVKGGSISCLSFTNTMIKLHIMNSIYIYSEILYF